MPPTTACPSSSTSSRCRLLELPAELRNRIYRDVLLDSFAIEVTRAKLNQPSLLVTCRQIRTEARGIYYLENTFSIRPERADPRFVLKFHQQAKGLWSNYKVSSEFATKFEYDFDVEDKLSWSNMEKWLKLYHMDEVSRMRECGHATTIAICCTIPRLFKMVACLDEMKWEVISRALNILMDSVEEQVEGRWSWNK